MAAVLPPAGAGAPGGGQDPFKWTSEKPYFSDDEEDDDEDEEDLDPSKCLLDLRTCKHKDKHHPGCGFKSYMRKTGCLNLR